MSKPIHEQSLRLGRTGLLAYLDIPLGELKWSDLPEDKGRAIVILALREIAQDDYQEYLRTGHWSIVRERVMREANWTCGCGARARDVHHDTYENLGDEQKGDCRALCGKCHARWTETWTHATRAELRQRGLL